MINSLTKYNELVANGVPHEDACKDAAKFLDTEPNVRENFLENVRNDALSSPEMRSLYYSRAHESSAIIGGIRREEDGSYSLEEKDIKQCNFSFNNVSNSRGDGATARAILVRVFI